MHLVDKCAEGPNQGANMKAPPLFSLSTFPPNPVSLNIYYHKLQ